MAEVSREQLNELYGKLKEANNKLKSKQPSHNTSAFDLGNPESNKVSQKNLKFEPREQSMPDLFQNRKDYNAGGHDQNYEDEQLEEQQPELKSLKNANLNKDSQKEIDIARDIIAHQESLHGSSMYSTKRLQMDGFEPNASMQEKFYHRGKERAIERQLMEQKVLTDIKKQANAKKMTEGSYKILIKKIENVLSTALMDSDPNGNKRITFEQLGRVLTVLGIFRVIQYNEDFDLENVELFYQNQNRDQNRRYQEMMIHEQLWNLCAENIDSDTIDTEIVYIVLRILLDPAALPSNEVAKLLEEYLQKYDEERHLGSPDKEKNDDDDEDEQIDRWPMEVIVTKFRALNENRLAFHKIGYLKYEKFDDIYEQNKKYTFKPKVSELSHAIERYHTERFLKENPIENLDATEQSGMGSKFGVSRSPRDQVNKKLFDPRDNTKDFSYYENSKMKDAQVQNRIKILYKKNELKNKWREDQKKQKELENLRECTFQPNVKYFKTQHERNENAFDRLYNYNKTQNKKEEQRLMEQIEKETDELEQCTFKPEINPNPAILQPKTAPKGYEKTILRMRHATELNEKKKERIEKIPSGENYERIKNANIKPFTFVLNPRAKRSPPFVYIDANVGPGKTGRIGIHEDDDPKILAQNFAISFQLSQEMQESLEDLISKQLQEHFEKKAGNF